MEKLILGLLKFALWSVLFFIAGTSGGALGVLMYFGMLLVWNWSAGFTFKKGNFRGDHLSPWC